MKKIIMCIFMVCLSVCVLAFTGCGGERGKTEEEQFNEAKRQFDNYTVDVTIQYAGGDKYVSTLQCDGNKGKLTYKRTEDIITYYSEDYGKAFYFKESIGEWEELASASTIEEATSDLNGYVYIIQMFFYDDFIKEDEYFVAKDSALTSYSEEYGIDIQSAKLKLENSKFVSATAIVEYFGSRLEVQYVFKDYGTTNVVLPA